MIDNKLYLENNYVISLGGDRFVGIDSGSGGYPYSTDFSSAGRFASVGQAMDYIGPNGISNYLNGNPEPVIMRVEYISFVPCDDDVNNIKEYEKELARLNKKYGRA